MPVLTLFITTLLSFIAGRLLTPIRVRSGKEEKERGGGGGEGAVCYPEIPPLVLHACLFLFVLLKACFLVSQDETRAIYVCTVEQAGLGVLMINTNGVCEVFR